MTQPAPIAVALDAPDLDTAARWAAMVTPHVSTVKIGLELYLRYGPEAVASVRGASGVQVFLDLKLHDIPATVAGAARAVARLRPDLLTVHAAGGPAMVRAAVDAAPGAKIIAVTVVTSLDSADLDRIGLAGPVPDAVRRLAVLAVEAGAHGAGLLAARGGRGARRSRPGHPAGHSGHPAGRRGRPRSGQSRHAGGGAAGRRRSTGGRPPHHGRRGPWCGRSRHGRIYPAYRDAGLSLSPLPAASARRTRPVSAHRVEPGLVSG